MAKKKNKKSKKELKMLVISSLIDFLIGILLIVIEHTFFNN